MKRRRSTQEWLDVEQVARIRGVAWRYFLCPNGCVAIWTTAPLYDGGDYMAVLLDVNNTVLRREYAPLRRDAKKHAEGWYEGIGRDLIIQEEP